MLQPNGTDLELKNTIDFSPSGLTINQHSVATAVNQIQLAQNSPAFRPIAAGLFFLPNTATLGRTYDLLSGEGVSATQQTGFGANDMFLTSIAHRAIYWISDDADDPAGQAFSGDADLIYAQQTPQNFASDSTGAPPEAARKWRMWTSGYGGQASFNGDSSVGSARANLQGGGFTMGLDDQINQNILVGVAGGSIWSTFDVPDRLTSGSVDSWHLAGYGAMRQDCFYTIGALAFDHFANDENRQAIIPGVSIPTPFGVPIVSPGFNQYLTGQFKSYSMSGYFEGGYKSQIGKLEVTPFAAVEFGSMDIDSFSETNQRVATNIGLSYSGRNISSVPTQLGVQLKAKTKPAPGKTLTAVVRVAWEHEFEPGRSMQSSFVTAPGYNFVIQGAQPPVDSLRAGAGLNLSVNRNFSVYANFDCDYGESGHSYAGMAGLRLSW